jgi:hypothetical protein
LTEITGRLVWKKKSTTKRRVLEKVVNYQLPAIWDEVKAAVAKHREG